MKASEGPAPPGTQSHARGISALAVRRFISTLVLASVGIVLGVFALSRLPVELLPSITYPRVLVRVQAPGVAPDVAVEEITRPLEEALASTEGAVQVYSQTREGQASLNLFFQPGEDIDTAITDATAVVNRVRNQLPAAAEPPQIIKLDPTQLPVLELALTSALLPLRELRVFAEEELARELIVVPGVAAVNVSGGVREEVQVLIDLERLQAIGLNIPQVLDAIAANNLDVSGGRLEARSREALARYRPDADPAQPEVQVRRDAGRASLLGLSSQAIGQTVQTALEGTVPTQLQRRERLVDIRVRLDKEDLRSARQLAQLPIAGNGGQVRLADVAAIDEGESPTEIQRINQREVFIIAGNLNQGVSLSAALAEADRILSGVPLPPGVVRLPSASAESNRALQQALVTLGALAVFFVFAVMAVQYDSLLDPFVILFTVPLALVGGVLGLVLTGTAFGATALLGVVLLVGVIVGNGIILVERANQWREDTGLARDAAIQRAAPERLRPILITTLLATLGLVPLAVGFSEGTELLRPLALVVLSGLSVGTLLTLFVVPCLYVALHTLRWRRA